MYTGKIKISRMMSLILSIFMVLMLQPVTSLSAESDGISDGQFSDVKEDDWYYEDVLYVYRLGVMLGVDCKAFFPEETTTRAEMITILYRLDGEPDTSSENSFTDLTQDWYKKAVFWGMKEGITNGTGSSSFSPDASINRSQMVTFLYRYARYKGIDVQSGVDQNALDSFNDRNEVEDYAESAMKWAVSIGIMNGSSTEPPTLDPAEKCSRAQMAAMIARFEKSMNVENSVDGVFNLVNLNGSVFFSDYEQGTFVIDNDSGNSKQISETGGSLCLTPEGILCWNPEDGNVYQVGEDTFSYFGKIPEYSQLIGNSGDILYWYSIGYNDREAGIYQTDITSGKTEQLLPMTENLLSARLIGQIIYYQTGTGVIYSFDTEQKLSSLISSEFEEKHVTEEGENAEQFYQSERCMFDDDFAVVSIHSMKKDSTGGYVVDRNAVYQISYESGKSVLLKEEKASSNFSLYNRMLYFVTLTNGNQALLQSYDLSSGKSETLQESGALMDAVEIAVSGEKCYYTISGVSESGVYCYDISTGQSTCIYKLISQKGTDEERELM